MKEVGGLFGKRQGSNGGRGTREGNEDMKMTTLYPYMQLYICMKMS
jgi:hypothetical protein